MIRCKNCGSTAQFKKVYEAETEHHLVQQFKCGCGATASLKYALVEISITTKEGTRL